MPYIMSICVRNINGEKTVKMNNATAERSMFSCMSWRYAPQNA